MKEKKNLEKNSFFFERTAHEKYEPKVTIIQAQLYQKDNHKHLKVNYIKSTITFGNIPIRMISAVQITITIS